MKKHELTIPEIGLIAGTRGMLGAGLALLLGDQMTARHRRNVGWTLFAIGAASTIPLVRHVMRNTRHYRRHAI